MRASTDMEAAPKDRNILVKTEVKHWHDSSWDRGRPRRLHRPSGYYPDGFQWIEARWVEAGGGLPARFAEWCGNPRTHSTGRLFPVAWAELPTESDA